MKTARCSPPCPARSPWPSPSRFSRPTRQRLGRGSFQIPVCTVRPFHSMSRGSPTFTDSSRAISALLWVGPSAGLAGRLTTALQVPSPEGEHERLGSRVEELDLERPVNDRL